MARKRPADTHTNSITRPLYLSASYFYRDTDEVIATHEGQTSLGRYGRYSNPTWTAVEERLAELDGAEAALVLTTGMTAIATATLALLPTGGRLLYGTPCYRNAKLFFSEMLPKFGIETHGLDISDPERFAGALADCVDRGPPDAIFLETPSNPHLYLADLKRIRGLIPDACLLIADSTLATPCNMQPLAHGADLVVHSLTKYLSGHGDVMGGAVSGRQDLIDAVRAYRNVLGGILDPQAAFLVNRSLDTLRMRMDAVNRSGAEVAAHLQRAPGVARVYHTSLSQHPHAALAERYLSGHGGVVSFEIDGSAEDTTAFVEALELPYMGSNFGAPTSLVEQVAVFSYYRSSPEDRRQLGLSDQLVRLSLGYEPVKDLIADLDQALCRAFDHGAVNRKLSAE